MIFDLRSSIFDLKAVRSTLGAAPSGCAACTRSQIADRTSQVASTSAFRIPRSAFTLVELPRPSALGPRAHCAPVGLSAISGQLSALKTQDSRLKTHNSAFTLVELLVTIAITGVILLVVNQVFNTVSTAVGVGMATSEILTNTRAVGEQFAKDAEQMLGPGDNAFMVIVNKRYNSQFIVAEDAETSTTRNVRSDQLTFFRSRGTMMPIAPEDDDRFSPPATTGASEVRIWYGHALRTNSDGDGPTGGLGAAGGPNAYAGNWVLGRQAIFLDASADITHWYANGAWYNADVMQVNGTDVPSPQKLWLGLADIAKRDLVGSASTDALVSANDEPGSPDADLLYKNTASGTYVDIALHYTFAESQRLRVNPVPEDTTFESWRIAQTLPYFAGHVSDFIVEFAGDYCNNTPDRDGSPAPSGPPDGNIDTFSDGGLVWYGLDVVPPTGGASIFVTAASNDTDSTRPIYNATATAAADRTYVFRHGSSGGSANWPYLIRIRYRLHDSRGKVVGADGELGRWFEYVLKVQR